MSSGDKCRWKWDDVHYQYNTSCGDYFMQEHGTDYLEPNFKFCPYCGREIEVVKDE